jgi:hypothetical protein
VTDFEGVFNPIGKIFIILHKLDFNKGNPKTTPIVYIRIKAPGLVYETKRMTLICNSPMSIKQTFIMYTFYYIDLSQMPLQIFLLR